MEISLKFDANEFLSTSNNVCPFHLIEMLDIDFITKICKVSATTNKLIIIYSIKIT